MLEVYLSTGVWRFISGWAIKALMRFALSYLHCWNKINEFAVFLNIKPNQTKPKNATLSHLLFLFLRVWFHWYTLIGMSSMCLRWIKAKQQHVPFGHKFMNETRVPPLHFWSVSHYFTLNRHLFCFIFSLWLNPISRVFFPTKSFFAFLYDTISNLCDFIRWNIFYRMFSCQTLSQYSKFSRKKHVWLNCSYFW